MATTIIDDCINCGACEDECPNGAISLGARDRSSSIPTSAPSASGITDEQLCAAACPPEACVPDPDAESRAKQALFERAQRSSTPIGPNPSPSTAEHLALPCERRLASGNAAEERSDV